MFHHLFFLQIFSFSEIVLVINSAIFRYTTRLFVWCHSCKNWAFMSDDHRLAAAFIHLHCPLPSFPPPWTDCSYKRQSGRPCCSHLDMLNSDLQHSRGVINYRLKRQRSCQKHQVRLWRLSSERREEGEVLNYKWRALSFSLVCVGVVLLQLGFFFLSKKVCFTSYFRMSGVICFCKKSNKYQIKKSDCNLFFSAFCSCEITLECF